MYCKANFKSVAKCKKRLCTAVFALFKKNTRRVAWPVLQSRCKALSALSQNTLKNTKTGRKSVGFLILTQAPKCTRSHCFPPQKHPKNGFVMRFAGKNSFFQLRARDFSFYMNAYSWAVCGLALCYPWQDMSSAGWVCTTLVFVWPLLAALAALLPLGESLRGNRPRAWQCAAALPLTLYAANMELLAGLLTLLLLAYLAWCLWAHRRPHWLAWAQLGLCAANIVYALTCPGTALRYGNEVTSWFQDYGMRSLWQNFELGISAAMSRMVLEPHLLFFVFCVLLACAVWARYRQPLYRLFSLFPVSAALVLGVLGGPLRALAPRLSFFADAVTEKGTLTPLNAWTLKRWLPFLLLCAVLFACALELYLALGHGTAAYAGVAVYLSGFASYGAMGFSPSIWASGARSGFFFAFALAAAGALVLRALPEKRMPWRVFGCTAAVCALAQCLSLLGA